MTLTLPRTLTRSPTLTQTRFCAIFQDFYDVVRRDDGKYVMLNLYLTDYCIWLQTVREELLDSLAAHLTTINVTQEDVGFPLPMLEALVRADLEDTQEAEVDGDEEDDEDDDEDESDESETDDSESDDSEASAESDHEREAVVEGTETKVTEAEHGATQNVESVAQAVDRVSLNM